MGGESPAGCMPLQWKYVQPLIAMAAAAAVWWHWRKQMDEVPRGKREASQTPRCLAVLQITLYTVKPDQQQWESELDLMAKVKQTWFYIANILLAQL